MKKDIPIIDFVSLLKSNKFLFKPIIKNIGLPAINEKLPHFSFYDKMFECSNIILNQNVPTISLSFIGDGILYLDLPNNLEAPNRIPTNKFQTMKLFENGRPVFNNLEISFFDNKINSCDLIKSITNENIISKTNSDTIIIDLSLISFDDIKNKKVILINPCTLKYDEIESNDNNLISNFEELAKLSFEELKLKAKIKVVNDINKPVVNDINFKKHNFDEIRSKYGDEYVNILKNAGLTEDGYRPISTYKSSQDFINIKIDKYSGSLPKVEDVKQRILENKKQTSLGELMSETLTYSSELIYNLEDLERNLDHIKEQKRFICWNLFFNKSKIKNNIVTFVDKKYGSIKVNFLINESL